MKTQQPTILLLQLCNQQSHLHISRASSQPTLSRETHFPLQTRSRLSPTIFAVEVDLHSPLLRPEEGLRHLGDGQTLGVGSVQEVARARLLHDLGTRVAAHVAEAIVAEDDGAVLDPRVGDDELAT